MREYEIRVLNEEGDTAFVFESMQSSDDAAVKAARKIAEGAAFEVWRDLDRIAQMYSDGPPRSDGGAHDGAEPGVRAAAHLLIEEYRDGAPMEAALRAARATRTRNPDAELFWDAVAGAVRAMSGPKPR